MTFPGVEAALRTKLVGSSAVTAIVGQKVYNLQAPAKTLLPYVVFYSASDILPNIVPRDTFNNVYRVECWASTGAGMDALAAVIEDILHKQSLSLSGWTNYWMAVEGRKVFIENVDGVQYYRRVHDIRIKASKNS